MTDADLNSYVVGTYGDTVSFGGQEIISLGVSDIFIVKYNSNDEFQWVSTINSAQTMSVSKQNTAVDREGNIYFCGFLQVLTIEDTTFTPVGGAIIKFDSDGNFDWVRDNCGASVLTINSEGDLIVSAVHIFSIVGDSTFSDFAAHLAKFDSEGNFIWVESITGLTQAPSLITCDPLDNILISVISFGTASIGGTSIPIYDVGLAKFSSTGVFEWIQVGSGAGMDMPLDLKTDSNGSSYLMGSTSDSLYFGDAVAPLGSIGNFLFKFENDGTPQWGTSSINTLGSALSVEPSGSVYFSGYTSTSTAYFGETDSLEANMFTGFIVKSNTSGSIEWIFATSSDMFSYCSDIHFTGGADGALYVAGNFYSNLTLDGIYLQAGDGTLTNNTVYFGRMVQEGYLSIGEANQPNQLHLMQNYPNPFNPSTTINYTLAEPSAVSLKIYDMLGREVISLTDQIQVAGEYELEWDGLNESGVQVSTGVYLAQLEAGATTKTIKMIYLQ